MISSTFGKNIKISIWGGSHEPAIGVDIAGFPVGTSISREALEAFLKRRAPGNSPFATKRKEPDIPLPTKGVSEEGSLGNETYILKEDTVSFEIRNTDQHSNDYKALRTVPRPGHADYTARIKYGDQLNMAGGGPFSARMTAPLCIAGGIAIQILEKMGIKIGAHILSIGNVYDDSIDPTNIPDQLIDQLKNKQPLAVINDDAGNEMGHVITDASKDLDSVGGTVEAFVTGLPAGIGGAMYDGIESTLAPILFGIPAVKGVEFGAGFQATKLRGSENNDAFYMDQDKIKTRTNFAGGILGGITSGMPLITRLAFKPTPSISQEQDSVDLETGENAKLIVKGRHDPCVVVRAVPIVEAALAIGILDAIMEDK